MKMNDKIGLHNSLMLSNNKIDIFIIGYKRLSIFIDFVYKWLMKLSTNSS